MHSTFVCKPLRDSVNSVQFSFFFTFVSSGHGQKFIKEDVGQTSWSHTFKPPPNIHTPSTSPFPWIKKIECSFWPSTPLHFSQQNGVKEDYTMGLGLISDIPVERCMTQDHNRIVSSSRAPLPPTCSNPCMSKKLICFVKFAHVRVIR